MEISRAQVDPSKFNSAAALPYDLRLMDFQLAMQDIYDFLYDVNTLLLGKGLPRMEASVRAAILSGLLSDLLSSSVARHSRVLVENRYPNGHPDLLRRGAYPNDSVKSGSLGVEIKTTSKRGGAVDTHGARDQWMAVFVYEAPVASDHVTPLRFREVYLGQVSASWFRRNPRGELGTRTATLNASGIASLRDSWVYLDVSSPVRSRRRTEAPPVRPELPPA